MTVAIITLLIGALFHKPILRIVGNIFGCLAMFLCCAIILIAWVIGEAVSLVDTACSLGWAFGRRTA